jgi:hypothetical protein
MRRNSGQEEEEEEEEREDEGRTARSDTRNGLDLSSAGGVPERQ